MMNPGITVGSGGRRRAWWRRDGTGIFVALCVVLLGAYLGRPSAEERLDPFEPVQRTELLRLQLMDLRKLEAGYRQALAQTARIRRLRDMCIQLQRSPDALLFTAGRVVEVADPEDAGPTEVVLSRGRLSGVAPRDVVVGSRGVVGQVVEVADLSSRAVLVTSDLVGVAARLEALSAPTTLLAAPDAAEGAAEGAADEPEETRGIVTGGRSDGMLSLGYLVPPDAVVAPGDLVETSGLGGVYPEGLPLGTVLTGPIRLPGHPPQALVRPYENWTRLREVLIVHGQVETSGSGQ